MIAHQLDLFGGPLKPPKKIKVDDEEIMVDAPKPMPEPVTAATVTQAETSSTAIPAAENADQPDALETGLNPAAAFAETAVIAVVMPLAEASFSSEASPTEISISEEAAEVFEDTTVYDSFEAEEFEALTHEPGIEELPATDEPEAIENEAFEEPGEADNEALAEIDAKNADDSLEIAAAGAEDARTAAPVVAAALPKVKRQSTEPEDGLHIPPDEELFKRQYYSMRETSAMFNVNQSLLRFWENEFDILQPKKNKKGDRYFRPVDIKNLVLIHNLLRVRKFTLEGAKEYLNKNKKAADSFELVKRLEKLKSFLLELKAGL